MNNLIKKFDLSDGTYIRYKVFGKGKPLILFHTFRNRLEYSENVAEFLKNKFTIYLIDLPGFGDSPISKNTNYDQGFFTDSIGFLLLIPFTRKLFINLFFKKRSIPTKKQGGETLDGEIIEKKKDEL